MAYQNCGSCPASGLYYGYCCDPRYTSPCCYSMKPQYIAAITIVTFLIFFLLPCVILCICCCCLKKDASSGTRPSSGPFASFSAGRPSYNTVNDTTAPTPVQYPVIPEYTYPAQPTAKVTPYPTDESQEVDKMPSSGYSVHYQQPPPYSQ